MTSSTAYDFETRWVRIAAGRVILGLTDDEARMLANISAGRARRLINDDPDALHQAREDLELEAKWGNVEYLMPLLSCAQPAHVVEHAAFEIAATPVTISEYARYMQVTGAAPPEGWELSRPRNTPITGISWHEAQAFAEWREATLPTEAQWERAARGPQRTLFPWGNEWGREGLQLDDDESFVPVGSRPDRATPEGVHDLVTVGFEWCLDEFQPYPGAPDGACKPSPTGGWRSCRVRRGGPILGLVSSGATRRGAGESLRLRDTTFRLVRKS